MSEVARLISTRDKKPFGDIRDVLKSELANLSLETLHSVAEDLHSAEIIGKETLAKL